LPARKQIFITAVARSQHREQRSSHQVAGDGGDQVEAFLVGEARNDSGSAGADVTWEVTPREFGFAGFLL
jgi:hypothetical protein